MNHVQKLIALVAVAAVVAVGFFAPFRYFGVDLPSQAPHVGTVYQPILGGTHAGQILRADGELVFLNDMDLEAGKFAIMLGLVLVAAVGLMLAGRNAGRRKCPHCAEYINAEALKCRYCGSDVAVNPTHA